MNDSSKSTLSIEQARHVAKLSRLTVPEAELEQYRHQLAMVLGYMAKLDEIDLDGIEPLAHPIGLTNRVDADAARPGLTLEEVLRNAPAKVDRSFSVPKVLGEGGG